MWVDKLASEESLAAIAADMQGASSHDYTGDIVGAATRLAVSPQWASFLAALRGVLHITGHSSCRFCIESVALNAFVFGARAAKRISELETLESLGLEKE